MTRMDRKHIEAWRADGSVDGPLDEARFASARTEMTDDERLVVEARIAEIQMADDPGADVVDSASVLSALAEFGFHPAFEYRGLVVGQQAFEDLRAAQAATPS